MDMGNTRPSKCLDKIADEYLMYRWFGATKRQDWVCMHCQGVDTITTDKRNATVRPE